MVVGLVEYLINSNEYSYKDITILTPYNGQLAAFSKRLSGTCSLWLSEKDRESLLLEGLLEQEEVHLGVKTEIALASFLRLATIDNFQGEESNVVILSTVRSNFESRVGFLKTPNRINVSCSRAKNGFYIVGNAALMSAVPMWRQIATELSAKGKSGPAFRTCCCSRHSNKVFHVQKPEDWHSVPDCETLCGSKLACGHLCTLKCHAPLHDRMGCTKPCLKRHEACGHQCTKTCGEPCGDCKFELTPMKLFCGHTVMQTCGGIQEGGKIICNVQLMPVKLTCGHVQQPLCSAKDQTLRCTEMCNRQLNCEHNCRASCHTCTVSKSHPQCNSPCDKELGCGHKCARICHVGADCGPCHLPCKRSCGHGNCSRSCSLTCDPCVKPCNRPAACPHKASCTMLCCLPCDQMPCNEPCTKIYLPCRHLCPSLCGEICPAGCPVCSFNDPCQKTYMFLPCGHYFELEYLDKSFDLANVYLVNNTGNIQGIASNILSRLKSMNLACPNCGESCKDVRRYALHHQLAELEGNVDRMYSKFSRKMNMFMDQIYNAKIGLDRSFNDFQESLKPGPLTGRSNTNLVHYRGNTTADVESRIKNFKDQVVQLFEDDISKLAAFLGVSPMSAHGLPTINLSYRLRFEALLIRSRLIILQESNRMLGTLRSMNDDSEHTNVLIRGLHSLTKDEANKHIKFLNGIITQCEIRRLKRLEAEIRLIQLCFEIVLEQLGTVGNLSVDTSLCRILRLCMTYPNTAGVLLETYNSTKLVLHGRRYHVNLYSRDSARIWWSWPAHQIGSLKKCIFGHQFSASTFPDCPECGLEVQSGAEHEPMDSKNVLKEDAFVAAMLTKTFSAASYRI